MDKDENIISEYEKIFGKPTRMSLFADDEELYRAFRQSIFEAPKEVYDPKGKLPFEGIKLESYDVFLLNQQCKDAITQGKHLYYIKDITDKAPRVFGAGYFDPQKNLFKLLAHSIIKRTDYTNILLKNEDDEFIRKFGKDGKYVAEEVACRSASLAASFVLGEKSSFTSWIPMGTKPLTENYPYFRRTDIIALEDDSFSPRIKEKTILPKEEEPIWKKVFPWLDKDFSNSRHLFSINKPGVCNAKGYYDEIEDVFVILAGSRFLEDLYSNYVPPRIITQRIDFIKESCEVLRGYCTVKKDTKVKTASLAASFVMGLKVWYSRWIDDDGKTLTDIYPQKYGVKATKRPGPEKPQESKPKPIVPIHFYIDKVMDYGSCKAEAVYDGATKSFKVLKGARFISRPALSFGFTVADYQRRLFLRKFCLLKNGCYMLKEDHIFDSPNLAATYLQGKEATGDEWNDENGMSIKNYNIDV